MRIAALMIVALLPWSPAQAQLEVADDAALSEITGQAFFDLSKQNITQPGGGSLTFTKLMLGGQMKINANIGELNLGPTGNEYLKLSNVSLSGGTGPNSVMTLQNPFIEFALENDGSTATRRLVGLRLGASNMNGVMGIGIQTNNGTDTGIDRFHGYMKAQSAPGSSNINGTANTAPFDFNKNVPIRIFVDVPRWLDWFNIMDGHFTADLNPDDPGFHVNALAVPFTIPGGVVVNTTNGPVSSITMTAQASMPNVPVQGYATVQNPRDYSNWRIAGLTQLITALFTLHPNVQTGISNLGAQFTIGEDLRYMHKLNLSGNGAGLSLQSKDVLWPGAPDNTVAKPGWWLAVSNPVNIGNLNPTTPIVITDNIQEQLKNQMSSYFFANPVYMNLDDVSASILGGTVSVPYANLAGNTVYANQNNLNLGASQTQPGNCFGGRAYC